MKFGRVLFAPICLSLLPLAAQAQETANAEKAPVKQKKTCRQLMPTGSIMSTRVCNTAVEWQKFDASGDAGANDFRRALRMTTTGDRSPSR